MSGAARTATGGRIDRSVELPFVVDGRPFVGHPGDTLASALLAAGVIEVGASIYRDRPRGIVAAGVEEPNALVNLRRPGQSVVEPMVPATTVELVAGLEATTLSGVGDLDPADDTSLYDKVFVHTDVLVIGAGPAGLAAARGAAATGARVIIIDDQPELGGSLLSDPEAAGASRLHEFEAELQAAPEVTVLTRTTAIGSYDANFVVALENRLDHLGEAAADATTAGVSRQRLWHIRAGEVVLATGAHERPLVFADNDRPGIMLASAVRTYLNRYGVLVGRRIVVATTNDSAYAMLPELIAAGAEVVLVADARDDLSPVARAARDAGVAVRTGTAPAGTAGEHHLSRVAVGPIDAQGTLTAIPAWIDADLLAVSGGWSPVVHLHSQRQGRLRWNDDVVAFVPDGSVDDQRVVGAAAGDLDLGPTRPLWLVRVPNAESSDLDTHFVDLQRDQTVADILRATGAGLRSVEHVKRYTSISTANDQGKTSAVNAIGVIAAALGGQASGPVSPGQVGTTTYRAPYTPVAFAALAGRNRGDLFDPARLTSIHPWHVAQRAEFELVGQWLRPRYYPHPGESMAAAVRRECAAVRTGVGMMDATTLGKIEIRGRDAGEFLNRIYTNAFKKLAPGSARYGLMCTPDGMIFDDGVTLRLDELRYLMTTTTGGAARVLDWLEEWHQTEWPDLDVALTSVTEQWTTVAVAGPRSRAVLAKLAPDVDVSNDAFPFMTFRDTVLACAVPARICRISFSGELAYEVNVSGWYGQAVWEEILEAGHEFGITPYGTETMHVLRAEKGYPIVGQDTDGSVTPHDAGMEWAVSKVKDFIGKRSFTRTDTARTDRKHLVTVLPVDQTFLLPEGAQLIGHTTTVNAGIQPVPMLGHVTSSYHSVALGRSFALAQIKNGRNLVGHTLTAAVGDRLVDVVVGDTVLYDPEGSRRDG